MALTKEQKITVVAELSELLKQSRMTVVAEYRGITVKSMQSLRREAKANGTAIKVVKNRLVKQAINNVDTLKGIDVASLKGKLLYAFNATDEVAPAKALNDFSKNEPSLQFIGAITS